jgi:hypothetical protein
LEGTGEGGDGRKEGRKEKKVRKEGKKLGKMMLGRKRKQGRKEGTSLSYAMHLPHQYVPPSSAAPPANVMW